MKRLPIGSYIDALNQSPKNLAHFLRYLDKNDELYNNYFKVKMRLKKTFIVPKESLKLSFICFNLSDEF